MTALDEAKSGLGEAQDTKAATEEKIKKGAGAAYNVYRDGQLMATITMTPAQAFYNLAMLPGWQKWLPMFRHGTLTSINEDANTGSITLDSSITSSAQDIVINRVSSLSGVEFNYMDCDWRAFKEDDEILVMFAPKGSAVTAWSQTQAIRNDVIALLNQLSLLQSQLTTMSGSSRDSIVIELVELNILYNKLVGELQVLLEEDPIDQGAVEAKEAEIEDVWGLMQDKEAELADADESIEDKKAEIEAKEAELSAKKVDLAASMSSMASNIADFAEPTIIGFKEEPQPCKPCAAFEAYNSSRQHIGYVVCRGDGFEGPYVFVPKTAEDESDPFGYGGYLSYGYSSMPFDSIEEYLETKTILGPVQDIPPTGVQNRVFYAQTGPTSTNTSLSVSESGTDSCNRVDDTGDWSIGVAGLKYFASRSTNLSMNHGFSIGEAGKDIDYDPDRWPSYYYEGNTVPSGELPLENSLSHGDLIYSSNGSGSKSGPWRAYDIYLFGSDRLSEAEEAAKAYVLGKTDGNFYDDSGTMEAVDTWREFINVGYLADYNWAISFSQSNSTSDLHWYNEMYSSAVDEDHYIFIFSPMTTIASRGFSQSTAEICAAHFDEVPDGEYNPPLPYTSDTDYSNIMIAFNGNEYDLGKPRFNDGNIRLYQYENYEWALGFVVPEDGSLNYISIIDESVEEEEEGIMHTMTFSATSGYRHVIPDITDLDGNTVYGNGQFRLVFGA